MRVELTPPAQSGKRPVLKTGRATGPHWLPHEELQTLNLKLQTSNFKPPAPASRPQPPGPSLQPPASRPQPPASSLQPSIPAAPASTRSASAFRRTSRGCSSATSTTGARHTDPPAAARGDAHMPTERSPEREAGPPRRGALGDDDDPRPAAGTRARPNEIGLLRGVVDVARQQFDRGFGDRQRAHQDLPGHFRVGRKCAPSRSNWIAPASLRSGLSTMRGA